MESGPGSSVGIATDYGLDGPGIESRWGARFSAPVQTGPGAHPSSCTMGTVSFPGVKSGRGVSLTHHPLVVPWSTPPMGRTACTEPQCLYKGDLYLSFTFYMENFLYYFLTFISLLFFTNFWLDDGSVYESKHFVQEDQYTKLLQSTPSVHVHVNLTTGDVQLTNIHIENPCNFKH